MLHHSCNQVEVQVILRTIHDTLKHFQSHSLSVLTYSIGPKFTVLLATDEFEIFKLSRSYRSHQIIVLIYVIEYKKQNSRP